eukprot:14061888-Alexandrium_andersonii.AAC.2
MDQTIVWSHRMALAGRFHDEVHALGDVRAIPKPANCSQLAASRVGNAAHGFPTSITYTGALPHEDGNVGNPWAAFPSLRSVPNSRPAELGMQPTDSQPALH